ncbi:hypothetical protein MHH33_12620 [Paenisporosarcina sp. FSL H8-0542]|uniref:hypothetical protein n=1 Tax=Paenisporosarcina sp. FSL H8-0542 TaxID=2921401 RepID=UPI00315A2F4C
MENKQELEPKRIEALALIKEWEYQLDKNRVLNESHLKSNHTSNLESSNEEI